MDISTERLLIIGKLIGIHRKEMLSTTKSARWTQADFCKDVCSEATLSKIEAGLETRFPENYIVFADKLGFKCTQITDVDEAILRLIDKMHHNMEYGYKEKVSTSCKKALKLLASLQDVMYYYDIFLIFDEMYDYLMKDIPFTKKYVIDVLKLMDILPEKLAELMKGFLFTNSYSHDGDKAFEKTCKALRMQESSYIANQMNLLLYYMVNNNGIKFVDLSKRLEKELIISKNYIRLFDMYNICLVMMSELDKDEVSSYVDKIEELIQKQVLPVAKISEYYHNRGLAFYMNSDFENALSCLESALKFDEDDILFTILFMAGCQRRLGIDVDIVDLEECKLKKYSKFLQSIYEYFKMDATESAFDKQKFIMDNIVPDLENNEPLFNDMFRYELNALVARTSQYKDTYIYDLKARKVLNK